MERRVALITGASRGLGLALARELSGRGWRLVVDGRDGARLRAAVASLPGPGGAVAMPSDVTDAWHRGALAAEVERLGRLDLLVNNASALGPTPMPRLAAYPVEALARVFLVNAIAPIALAGRLIPALERSRGRVVNISSDAAVEAYAGWGGYGAAKAALDHLGAVLAAEHPDVLVYTIDPGDMLTDMAREAFGGAPPEGLAEPEAVVPALLRLVEGDLPSGRYRATGLRAAEVAS